MKLKNSIFAFILAITTLVTLVACVPAQPQSGEVLKSDKQRVTSPVVSQPDLAALVEGDNAFALDLYQVSKTATISSTRHTASLWLWL